MIERIDLLAKPQMCVWCKDCGVVFCDGVWGYVCLRAGNGRILTKRMKDVIRPLPVNTEGRTSVQCVNADEYHECFMPTKTTERMRLMEQLGLVGGNDD